MDIQFPYLIHKVPKAPFPIDESEFKISKFSCITKSEFENLEDFGAPIKDHLE